MSVRFAWLLFLLINCLLVTSPSVVLSGNYVEENNQALKLLAQERYLAGIDLLKKSLQAAPYDEAIKQNLLLGYRSAGQALVAQQRYQELTDLMLEAQEFDDTQRVFWTLRGYAWYRLKKHARAEIELQEARAMGAPDVQILFLLGKIYYGTDRMYEAVDVLQEAALLAPDDHGVARTLEKVRRELAVEGDMAKEVGGSFVITFDGDKNDQLGSEVLAVLEDAYNWIGSQLDYYPDGRVTVILYSRQQFSKLTNSPDWSGGLYDGKIRLPVGGISSVDSAVKSLLYHEFMHVVLRDIAGNNLPYWLNEGLAEVAAAHIRPLELEPLFAARAQGTLFRLATLEKPFRKFSGRQATLAYQQSYSVVRYLLDEFGWHHARDLVFALGQGLSIEAAIEQVLGGFGLSYPSFEQRWRESG